MPHAAEKTMKDLTWLLPEDYRFHFRHAANRAAMEDPEAVPHVGGHSRVWWHTGRVMRAFFVAIGLILLAFTVYGAVWNSAARTETVSLRAEQGGRVLSYAYEVDGKRYERSESPGSLHKSSWDEGDAMETVRYLSFSPERAHLDFKVEPFSWFTALSVLGFVACLAYAGHVMMRSQNYLQRLVEGCTHVLPGKITRVVPGRGYSFLSYEAYGPQEGKTIVGQVQLGRAEPAGNDLVAGASVAVLYRDDATHTLL